MARSISEGRVGIALLLFAVATLPGAARQKGGEDETGPYDVAANWLKPIAPGWIVYAVDVFAETPDRIFIGSTGASPMPAPLDGRRGGPPQQLFNLNLPGAKLDHFLVTVNRNGEVVERWSQWYDRFRVPHRITMDPYDPEKHVWFVDRGSQQIFKFTHDGKRLVMTLGEKDVAGSDEKHFGRPTDIAFLPDGTFFVSDGYDNTRVVKFDKGGKFLMQWGTKGKGPGQFDLPHCIAVDARRRVYVADRSNHRIQVFDENGTFLDEWPNIPQPHHMMITQDQFLWLSDGTTSRIAKYDLNGKLLAYWGTQGTSPGYMNQPHAFSVDSEGNLYIANGLNQRVEKYTPKPDADRARLVGPQFGPPAAAAQKAAGPTFNQDVAPILFANCVSCHRPGDIAPMSLLSYESARPWARAIRARVVAREMPPWPADSRYGLFKNAHRLTDAQVDTIAAWADTGALQGDGAPPPAPRFVEGWASQMDRPPDQVIEAPTAFELPPDGVIPEFTIWAKVPFGKERFIEAVELRPTNRAIIHHARVSRTRLPRDVKIAKGEMWPGGPVLDGLPVTRSGSPAVLPPAVSFGQPLIFYVPAGGFLRFPKGVGKRIQSDDYLMWTFHLTTTGKMERGGMRIGLWFSRGDVDHEVTTWTVTDKVMVNGKEVARDARGPQFPNIAPHEADYTVTGLMRVTEPIMLYALWPHMHARGRDMTFILQDRKGNEQTLLSVPAYKFAWQFTYELATPLKIPAGSTIKAIAHYDNSSRNRENPDPNQEVTWGPQSTNEMFDPFLEFAVDRPVTMRQRPSEFGGLDVPGPQ